MPNRLEQGLLSQPANAATQVQQVTDTGTRPPGSGGWVPPVWLPIVFVTVGGALTAVLPFVSGVASIVVSVLLGILASVGSALGIASAGPRKV